MTKSWIVGSLALAGVLVSTNADAQRRRPVRKARPVASRSGAESGLLGVKLFDTGIRVVGLYGNPDRIEAVSLAGGLNNPGGGGGGGGRGGFGGPPGRGGGGGGGGAPSLDLTGPGDFGGVSDLPELDRQAPSIAPPGSGGGQGRGGPPPGAGGPGGFAPPGGAPGGGATTATTADYTRWIYTKNGAKFGFVLDKFNRVIQIEAVGLQNQRVKTRRGISFGSTFSQVIKAYAPSSAPDSYDVAGDTVTVKFLTRQRVAFRLSKLGTKRPHVVTGIVVAAGKG